MKHSIFFPAIPFILLSVNAFNLHVQVLDFVVVNPFPKQALVFACLKYISFENTVENGEIARYEQFPPFPNSVSYPFEDRSDIFT